MGVGCAFSAAQRAASVTLKIHVLIFKQERAALGLLSTESGLPCPELWADMFKEAREVYSAQG